jgi:hypothetical protein
MYLQLRIFNPEYSTERICAAVGDMPISACVLFCKFCAKYRAQPPVCAMWTVVPDIYNAFTAPHIQTSMFFWTYQRCYWRYLDNYIVVILQTWCQIQRTSSASTLCELWSRTYTMHLQLHIFRLQYSFHRICPAIVIITTIPCALYCKPVNKYSAHPPIYAMWTVVPDIYNVITAPHIQASIFDWTNLRYYCR